GTSAQSPAAQTESTAPPRTARDKPLPAAPRSANTNSSSSLPTSLQTTDTSAPAPSRFRRQTISDSPHSSRAPPALHPPAPHLQHSRARQSPHRRHVGPSEIARWPLLPSIAEGSPFRTKNIPPAGSTQTESAISRTSFASLVQAKTKPAPRPV